MPDYLTMVVLKLVDKNAECPAFLVLIENTFSIPRATAGPATEAGDELFSAGVYNMRQRWYDPSLQRFISRDPIGTRGGGGNLYEYCENSPTTYLDPFGLKGYKSADDAAKAALDAAGQPSRDMHRELGGFICKTQDGLFHYTPPIAAKDRNRNIGFNEEHARRWAEERCCKIVGWYHTHVYFKTYTNENFSPEDLKISGQRKLPAYLLTVGGKVLQFDPSKTPSKTKASEILDPGSPYIQQIGTVELQGSPRTDMLPSP